MLQQTAARLPKQLFTAPLVVSSENQRFFIKRQLEEINTEAEAILLEPAGRNTAPAAALAAAWVAAQGRDELLLLMPADHVIGDVDGYLEAIEAGRGHAHEGAIVTFGATPTEPNSQYGYIEADISVDAARGISPIAQFVEKPDAKTAADYVASGRFFWNAGIFLVKASTLLQEMLQFLPATAEAVRRSINDGTIDGVFVRPHAAAFSQAENISIDHAIMEKTSRGMVVPVSMQWSDVGSWDAVWKLGDKDYDDNVVHGDVVSLDNRKSLLRNDDGTTIAAVGLENMAVIAVRDAVLVAPLDRMADLKTLVGAVRERNSERVAAPAKVVRPWGSYETIAAGPGFQVKRIIVEPGEKLSLQLHHQRSEHWVVVKGTAEVTVDEKVSTLSANESIYIPVETKHRLVNPGTDSLELIEVQCGEYLGEDDILRFEDVYGRA